MESLQSIIHLMRLPLSLRWFRGGAEMYIVLRTTFNGESSELGRFAEREGAEEFVMSVLRRRMMSSPCYWDTFRDGDVFGFTINGLTDAYGIEKVME